MSAAIQRDLEFPRLPGVTRQPNRSPAIWTPNQPRQDPTPEAESNHCRPDWSPIHSSCLFAIIEGNHELDGLHVVIDPTIDPELAKKNEYLGVFSVAFAGFKLTLNWTPQYQGNVPPRHIAVECLGEPVAIVGPYLKLRKCWKCRLEGYRDEACKQPWVEPGAPCPRCGNLDWWGKVVTPWHLQDACGEFISKQTGQDKYWKHFDGDGAQRRLKGGLT